MDTPQEMPQVTEHTSNEQPPTHAILSTKDSFIRNARKDIEPLLQAMREAEQIGADDRHVFINAQSD